MNSISDIFLAARFAALKHHGQLRKGEDPEPYIVHPIEAAQLLSEVGGVTDPDILIAALLHDTIEDTDATEEEISELFGSRVASIVVELTDDMSLPKEQRKLLQQEHAPSMSPEAKQVKMCDKMSNIFDLVSNPPDWSAEQMIEYVEWGERVFEGLRGVNPPLERKFDELVKRAKRELRTED